MTAQAVRKLARADIRRALARGTLTMHLGPFRHLISGAGKSLLDYLEDTYRDYLFELTPSDVTDIYLNIRAPNLFRRYIRPQVTPDPGFDVPAVPLPKALSPLAFEMGLNLSVALKCTRYLIVHAGVVADQTGAIVMSGASGAGKSTLTAALLHKGYRLLSDEFALIGLKETTLQPYPRPISLKQGTIPIVREIVGNEWISKTLHGTPKGDIAYYRARPNDLAMAHLPAQPKLILFPHFEKGAMPMARRLNPAEAVMRLIPASTNYAMLGEPAFRAVTEMVERASAYELSYGSTAQSLKLVAELTESGKTP